MSLDFGPALTGEIVSKSTVSDIICDPDTCFILNNVIPYSASKMHRLKVSKGAKIRNRYNQVPHLTQDTNGKVTIPQLDTTNDSQEVSPYLLLQIFADIDL